MTRTGACSLGGEDLEPETSDIGPKTYAKICELLLRLKANYLWPAMHACTTAFNAIPENKVVADHYGIVMGSSHAEPMLRNNVGEWTDCRGTNTTTLTNRDGILKYWEQRLLENGQYENIYTIGIRGIHDSPDARRRLDRGQVARLQQVIADQRQCSPAMSIPTHAGPADLQPYKEVLALYQHGLKVPDDVTSFGPTTITATSATSQPRRSRSAPAASGVYYHVSYWGAPEDYLWLCTTSPALIWEEMHKAYDNGARTLWVLNVGGLKKSAIDMDFFMRMAWDIECMGPGCAASFPEKWATENFRRANMRRRSPPSWHDISRLHSSLQA